MKMFKNDVVEVEVDMDSLKVVDLKNDKEFKSSSKSNVFKILYELGMNIGDISRLCESHYSFVYGVIERKCEMRKKKESKSEVIRKMVLEGKSCGEISKELNSNYSFVFSVVKKYKGSKEYEEKVNMK